MSKQYITTAIPYVNGEPHIGHALDYCIADVYARFRRLLGDEIRFQVGTDEHGSKIFQKSVEQNKNVQDYVDENSLKFQNFIKKLNIEYTDFIRTTNQNHVESCQKIWLKLEPYIYAADYEGWYCDGCERFITEKEYTENNGVCPDHQKPYQKLREKNYYLKISEFKDRIKTAIESDAMQILPEFRKKEVLKLLDETPDVSISRPKEQLSWGVPVPDDDSQVMYVWIDALVNYITVLGYPDHDISAWWPADVQFVGKDILRFHAIIWPAILLALDLPLPKVLCSHGHVLSNGQKMSKSIGNTVNPIEVIEKHGVDPFRYYFLRHVDTFADSDFTWESFEDSYNNELANDLGNLVQRLASMDSKNNIKGLSDFHPTFTEKYLDLMNNFAFSNAFDYVWGQVQAINKDIDIEKPWQLKKDGDIAKLEQVLGKMNQDILTVAFELLPFLPETAKKISDIFSAEQILPPSSPLFPKQ